MTLNLVEDFIAKRLNEYVEPQVFGNPKRTRRPYGYSKNRYAAYLYLALTSLTGEQIGERIGKSASLVRKWHSQRKEELEVELKFFTEYAYSQINAAIRTGQRFHFGDVAIWSSSAALRILRAIRRNSGNAPGTVYHTLRTALKEIERDVPGEWKKFPKKIEKTTTAVDQLAGYETNPRVELRQILGFVNDRLHKWIVGVLRDARSRKSDRAVAEWLIRGLLTESKQAKTTRFNNARRKLSKQQSAAVE